MKAVLASSNAGKLRELAAILSPLGYELITQNSLDIDTPPGFDSPDLISLGVTWTFF